MLGESFLKLFSLNWKVLFSQKQRTQTFKCHPWQTKYLRIAKKTYQTSENWQLFLFLYSSNPHQFNIQDPTKTYNYLDLAFDPVKRHYFDNGIFFKAYQHQILLYSNWRQVYLLISINLLVRSLRWIIFFIKLLSSGDCDFLRGGLKCRLINNHHENLLSCF